MVERPPRLRGEGIGGARSASDFELLEAEPRHGVACWRNVTICVIRTEASLQSIEASLQAHQQVLDRGYPKVLALTIGETGAGVPSPALQRIAAQRAKELSSTLQSSVVVVLGEGFWLAATRSVITGINLLVPSFRLAFETDLDRGIAHLANAAGESFGWRNGLADAVAETRRFDLAPISGPVRRR
jgi:hypothetical protein